MDPHDRDRRVVQEEIIETPEGTAAERVERRTHVDPSPAEEREDSLHRIQQIVWMLAGILVTLIALRFVLLATGANMTAGFGGLLFNVTQPFVAPFLPLFGEQQATLQWGSLVAIVVYLLLAWVINRLLAVLLAPRL